MFFDEEMLLDLRLNIMNKYVDKFVITEATYMHSGKSTLSQAIAHAIHTTAKIPYAIKVLYKPDLLDFKGTLAKLEPVNQILIFDDVSFIGAEANRKQIESVKSAISTIRHLDGGKDVKIIVLMNYHYSQLKILVVIIGQCMDLGQKMGTHFYLMILTLS